MGVRNFVQSVRQRQQDQSIPNSSAKKHRQQTFFSELLDRFIENLYFTMQW